MSLTRDSLLRGDLARMIHDGGEGHRVLSDEMRQNSLDATLSQWDQQSDVWVFGYGSLIWNPAFHYVDRVCALLPDHHRAFCLWTHLGRGTPDCPGLTLGLEPGGSCHGVAFRITRDAVRTELDVIWRREMVTGAYRPTWVTVEAGNDGGAIPALTFVMDSTNDRYACGLTIEEAARTIAVAEGGLGTCREYLFNTVAHLEDLGLPDPELQTLAAMVREHRGS